MNFLPPNYSIDTPPDGTTSTINPVDFAGGTLQTTIAGPVAAVPAVTHWAYSVDGGQVLAVVPTVIAGRWSFPLLGSNCNPPNFFHDVTVLAWDGSGGLTVKTKHFYRRA